MWSVGIPTLPGNLVFWPHISLDGHHDIRSADVCNLIKPVGARWTYPERPEIGNRLGPNPSPAHDLFCSDCGTNYEETVFLLPTRYSFCKRRRSNKAKIVTPFFISGQTLEELIRF